MKRSRRVSAVLAMMVAGVLGSVGWFMSSAQAQTAVDRLRSEVITAEELTEEHRQQIAEYTEYWALRLREAGDQQVPEARSRLLEPLRANPSEAFVRQYSTQVGQQVAPGLDEDRLIVRLNTMIVVTRLSGPEAMPLIERGMADANPAVRYWAIKAVQTVSFADREKRGLMERLITHLDRETEVTVAEQTMLALADLNLPEATPRVLEVLNARVDRHLAQPGQSLQAEYSGLHRVYRRLAGAGSPDQQSLRQLARAAVRYQDLAAQQLAEGELPAEMRDLYVRMIQLCNATLQLTGNSLNASGTPGSIQLPVNQQDWAAVRRNAEQWRTLMRRQPYELSDEDLALHTSE